MPNFAEPRFCELRIDGVLRSSQKKGSFLVHLGDVLSVAGCVEYARRGSHHLAEARTQLGPARGRGCVGASGRMVPAAAASGR